MGRILKGLVILLIIGFIGLVGYAYLGDMRPERQTISEPVTLDVN
ncbi:hypothetical protein [Actibacterium lipolyticum]|uniref:Uncharacterized protein n=1 Tax=Actibacterium lipolyticum TaxID=1524263 RepID=A0A238JYJ4_9RHOB|nr:hypothetical protein [Actibacterium lipolyticum]SMX34912.1 hypothetical protein COL8621_01554 [Actibacterium lipolyticum]